MRRRELFPLIGLILAPAAKAADPAPQAATPFDAGSVRNLARDLASKPWQAPDTTLPDQLKDLDYSAYRTVRFDKNKALWRGDRSRFSVEFFHRGFLFKDRVDIFEVANGQAKQIRYSPDLFDMGKVQQAPAEDLGFAGFRVHYPINRPEYQDEVCAFLGASYFRAVARGQGYGLSARGLAI